MVTNFLVGAALFFMSTDMALGVAKHLKDESWWAVATTIGFILWFWAFIDFVRNYEIKRRGE